MRIAEVYASLQGEGLLAGTPSTFVRTSGCNLRCVWCDTPFTSWDPQGEDREVAEVRAEVETLGPRHVVVTGGEPLLSAQAVELCLALRHDGFHVTVETAGTVLPATRDTVADLMSISPKLASSAPPAGTPGGWRARHEATRRRDDVLRALAAGPHQFKFVIDAPADLAEARGWLAELGDVDPRNVFLMPQGRDAGELARTGAWLEEECRRAGFRFAPRHHIAWFGHARGT
jgi:7-carboxy-7-deazaguanine synthase